MSWQQQINSAHQALEQGNLQAAEFLLWDALKQAEQFGPGSNQLTETAQNLSDVLLRQAKYKDAEDLLLRLAEVLGSAGGSNGLNSANTLLKLAELYYAQGMFSRAEPFAVNALRSYESIYGEKHEETARVSGNVAYIFHAQEKLAQAEEHYKRAIAIKTKNSKYDQEALNVLQSYATLLRSSHRGQEADHLLRCVEGLVSGNWEVYRPEPEQDQLTE
jgi:tetratricopeptide (TPR) repeat protein